MNKSNYDSNDARGLDKLRRHYEHLMRDPFLSQNILNIRANYERVMKRIDQLTDPFMEENVYSIPGIARPRLND